MVEAGAVTRTTWYPRTGDGEEGGGDTAGVTVGDIGVATTTATTDKMLGVNCVRCEFRGRDKALVVGLCGKCLDEARLPSWHSALTALGHSGYFCVVS